MQQGASSEWRSRGGVCDETITWQLPPLDVLNSAKGLENFVKLDRNICCDSSQRTNLRDAKPSLLFSDPFQDAPNNVGRGSPLRFETWSRGRRGHAGHEASFYVHCPLGQLENSLSSV